MLLNVYSCVFIFVYQPEAHEACLRGCRLSAIGQLSSPRRNKENASEICITGWIIVLIHDIVLKG